MLKCDEHTLNGSYNVYFSLYLSEKNDFLLPFCMNSKYDVSAVVICAPHAEQASGSSAALTLLWDTATFSALLYSCLQLAVSVDIFRCAHENSDGY